MEQSGQDVRFAIGRDPISIFGRQRQLREHWWWQPSSAKKQRWSEPMGRFTGVSEVGGHMLGAPWLWRRECERVLQRQLRSLKPTGTFSSER